MPLTVVNMIPESMSGESSRDSEVNVSVSGADANLIVATALTPGQTKSPLYMSTDGGLTWSLKYVVPPVSMTHVTARFAGASPHVYTAVLAGWENMTVLRGTPPFSAGLTQLASRLWEEQPYVEAARPLHGGAPVAGRDKVFVGHNLVDGSTPRTASLEIFQNAAASPGHIRRSLDGGAGVGRDGPSVRAALHSRGVVYACFFRYTDVVGSTATRDVVVVRDDNWGAGSSPFTALGLNGISVATNSKVEMGALLGTQRIGSQIAIAVDPRERMNVWLAWCDEDPQGNYLLHLKWSVNGGLTWATDDLRTVVNATNPGVAVNLHGKVALSYQRLVPDPFAWPTPNRWETHLELMPDGTNQWTDLVMADVPDLTGSYQGPSPIGDYMGLVSLGKNFYGGFAAYNEPKYWIAPNDRFGSGTYMGGVGSCPKVPPTLHTTATRLRRRSILSSSSGSMWTQERTFT
jgi:hypothetical protein